jgi:hypothetical protein
MSAFERASLDGLEPGDRPREPGEMPTFEDLSVFKERIADLA